MKKIFAFCLAAVLSLTAAAASAEKYSAMPDIFKLTQTTESTTLNGATVRKTYPDCANESVNAAMCGVIDELAARAEADTAAAAPTLLDTGAYISRTGDSAMSFLTVAFADKGSAQVYAACDARVYDLSTGARYALSDLILPESGAWATLADAVRARVTEYFRGESPSETALAAACDAASLQNAAFTLSPAYLILHYAASDFYPGKTTLIHVRVPYRLLSDAWTEAGAAQTDCSRFHVIALTYDDGPVRGRTEKMIDVLREFGANATFFCIGQYYDNCRDILCRQHDAAFAVESHGYQHVYDLDITTAVRYAERVDKLMAEIIGIGPSMMRAPGGDHTRYRQGKVPLPYIGWNLMSDDVGADDAARVSRRVIGLAADGKVVLMHDLNRLAPTYSRDILTALESRGFLFVTVAELYEIYGIELTPCFPFNGTDTTQAAVTK